MFGRHRPTPHHGIAVFTGLTTPTDAEIEAATYVNAANVTLANTTTRISGGQGRRGMTITGDMQNS